MSTNTTSTNSASNAGSTAGQKVKGAFQAVHGIGEAIRGNAMDFVDSATGTQRKEHGATIRGQQETEVGVANMESHAPPAGTTPLQTNTAGVGAGTAAGGAGVPTRAPGSSVI